MLKEKGKDLQEAEKTIKGKHYLISFLFVEF